MASSTALFKAPVGLKKIPAATSVSVAGQCRPFHFCEETDGQLFADDFGTAWLFLDFNSFASTAPAN